MKKLCILVIGFVGLLALGLVFTGTNVQAQTGPYDVTFQSTFDAANVGSPSSLGTQAYNTTIQLETNVNNATSPEGDYVFAFWVVNGAVRSDLPVNHTFTVVGDVAFIAVFSKVGENAVLFMDSNSKLIDTQYVLDSNNADDTGLTLPDKPGYDVSTTAKWSGSTTNITNDAVLILQYERSSTATFTLTVTNGTGDGTYNYNDVVTVTPDAAPTGEVFSHWEDPTGIVLSTESEYQFSMLEDKTVVAVFGTSAIADDPRIILSDDLEIRTGSRSYVAQFHLPTGYSLVDYGMLTLPEDKPIVDFDTENVVINQGFKYFGQTNEFIMSFATGSHYSIRAYLVVEDAGGTLHNYYSEQNPQYVHQGPVNLRSAYDYTILSESGITTTGTTAITGDLGVSPSTSTSITGFGLTMDPSGEFATSSLVTGKIYASDYSTPTPGNLITANSDMETAYTDAAGRASDYTEYQSGDISGQTLSPGVYNWTTGVSINTDVTISGSATDTWIFQIAGNLTQAADVQVILSGGAVAENIVWQVAGQTDVGARAHFEGTILCKTLVNLQTDASMNGRILSQTAVTLDANKIN